QNISPYGEVAVAISSGFYTSGGYRVEKAIRAVLKVDNPGDYFCASATKLIIGADSDWTAGQGTIYGDILEFIDDNPGDDSNHPHILINGAEYHSQTIPGDTAALVYDPPANNGFAQFTIAPSSGPQKVTHKVLPVISNGLMRTYYETAYNDGVDSSFFSELGMGADYGSSDNPLDTNISPLADPSGTNDSNVWYYPSAPPDESTEDLYINHLTYNFSTSCIIAVNGNLYIRGDIDRYAGGSAIFAPGSFGLIPPPGMDSGGCFLPGTPVSMADGSMTAVEKIKIGDKVLAYNEKKEEHAIDTVTNVFIRKNADGYLEINDMKVTSEHPLMVKDKGWVKAGSVKLGDKLMRVDRSLEEIIYINKVAG
ncbi:MAG: hypothetical protein L0922_07715, partial [Candidatus Mariimomonas ferrooxydans]